MKIFNLLKSISHTCVQTVSKKCRSCETTITVFLKSNKIYGAEIAKQGFSGYISEVLILEFGSFENLIKSISKIKENQIIGKTSKSFDTSMSAVAPTTLTFNN